MPAELLHLQADSDAHGWRNRRSSATTGPTIRWASRNRTIPAGAGCPSSSASVRRCALQGSFRSSRNRSPARRVCIKCAQALGAMPVGLEGGTGWRPDERTHHCLDANDRDDHPPHKMDEIDQAGWHCSSLHDKPRCGRQPATGGASAARARERARHDPASLGGEVSARRATVARPTRGGYVPRTSACAALGSPAVGRDTSGCQRRRRYEPLHREYPDS